MAIQYKAGWNTEIHRYAVRYGPYAAFLQSFNENAVNAALHDATGHFHDHWCQEFIRIAMDRMTKRW